MSSVFSFREKTKQLDDKMKELERDKDDLLKQCNLAKDLVQMEKKRTKAAEGEKL